MSIQFVFWRTMKQLDSQKVYRRLNEGRNVRGLEPLDLAQAERALIDALPDWTVEAQRSDGHEQTMLSGPQNRGGLDVHYSPQSVNCTCYGMDEDQLNLVIGAMIDLKLPLYDAQLGERFDGASR